jgi:hypothetical protein
MKTKKVPIEGWQTGIVQVLIGGVEFGIEGTDPTFVDGWDGISGTEWL